MSDHRESNCPRRVSLRSLGDALTAQQENAPNEPQPQGYYSEHMPLPSDKGSAVVILRGVFNERVWLEADQRNQGTKRRRPLAGVGHFGVLLQVSSLSGTVA